MKTSEFFWGYDKRKGKIIKKVYAKTQFSVYENSFFFSVMKMARKSFD